MLASLLAILTGWRKRRSDWLCCRRYGLSIDSCWTGLESKNHFDTAASTTSVNDRQTESFPKNLGAGENALGMSLARLTTAEDYLLWA